MKILMIRTVSGYPVALYELISEDDKLVWKHLYGLDTKLEGHRQITESTRTIERSFFRTVRGMYVEYKEGDLTD